MIPTLILDSKLRNIIDGRVATIKDVRDKRVLVTIEGSRVWLDYADIRAAWRSNPRPA